LKTIREQNTGENSEYQFTYLPTELEIDHHNGYLGTGDDQYEKDKEQESKQIVELILPDGL